MKTRLITFTFLLISLAINSQDVSFEWAKQIGGNFDECSYSIALDLQGNIFTTGFFFGLADFDPDTGSYNLISSGSADIFISKLDSSGKFEWARQFGGESWDRCESIAVDTEGNVYTTGTFEGTVDFDPDTSTFILTSIGHFDCFISKLDANGNFVWVKQIGGDEWSWGTDAIDVDAMGNVYTSGRFAETADFDPGDNINNLTSAGYDDVYILKLDVNGNFIWVMQIGGIDSEQSNSVVVDDFNNIYITGTIMGTTDFDPGPGIFNLTSAGESDIFISKFNADGDFVWAKQLGGTDIDVSNSIKVDVVGNVYTTGKFSGTADFDPGTAMYTLTSTGNHNVYISKLDTDGNFIWAKQIEGNYSGVGNSITVDAYNKVYTTGYFIGTADFDPGPEIYNSNPAMNYDIFILKLNAHGNFDWVQQIGGTFIDLGHSVAVDPSMNVYTTGCFSGTADFDPGAGNYNLIAEGINDIYIQKMSQQILGTKEYKSGEAIMLFPNPTNGQFTVDLGTFYSDITIIVRNYIGQIISTENQINADKLFLELEGDIGIYLVEILSAGRQVTQMKVIKN